MALGRYRGGTAVLRSNHNNDTDKPDDGTALAIPKYHPSDERVFAETVRVLREERALYVLCRIMKYYLDNKVKVELDECFRMTCQVLIGMAGDPDCRQVMAGLVPVILPLAKKLAGTLDATAIGENTNGYTYHSSRTLPANLMGYLQYTAVYCV